MADCSESVQHRRIGSGIDRLSFRFSRDVRQRERPDHLSAMSIFRGLGLYTLSVWATPGAT